MYYDKEMDGPWCQGGTSGTGTSGGGSKSDKDAPPPKDSQGSDRSSDDTQGASA